MRSVSIDTKPDREAAVSVSGRAGVHWSRISAPVRREILVALFLLLIYGYFQQGAGWNENSRFDLIRALVEQRTTKIDHFEQNTGDKAFYQGHYYSDKAPGTSLIGAPVYVLLKIGARVTGTAPVDPRVAIETMAFVESGVSTVLLVILLLRFLRPSAGEVWALVISLGYGLGSIALPFATMFFGHAISTFFLFEAFYLLWRWRAEPRTWRPVLAGVAAGFAVLMEIPLVLGVAILGIYALWLGRRQFLLFVLGGIPISIVLMLYDWISFGSPVSIGYQYATFFANQNQQGIVSVVWPSWMRADLLLLGPRGLLHFAPWFAAAPFGLLAARRQVVRAEVIVCAAICTAFLTYNSGALNPLGGWTPGPRYLLPALPFATVLVALAPSIIRPVVAILIAISIAVFFVATATYPSAPTVYHDPLFEFWLPRLFGGDITPTVAQLRWGVDGRTSLVILVAAAVGAGAGLLATFRSGRPASRLTGLVAGALVLLVSALAIPFLL